MSESNRRLRVAVLAGGPSSEREVSLDSGRAVADGLTARGCRVTMMAVGAAPGSKGTDSPERAIAASRRQLEQVPWHDFDVVFNALHGRFGEDGELQSLLESLRVPYTGSSPAASRLAFHKEAAKQCLRVHGIATPRGVCFDEAWSPAQLEGAAQTLGWPVVVKPEAQGSSLGVSIVRSPVELPAAISLCRSLGPQGLIETYIPGTEWTVPIWDDSILPIIEIVPATDFYDYRAKYVDDRTAYCFESDLPPAIVKRIAETGRAAARVLGTAGLARVDLRLDAGGQPWVLEVNTSPGMTDHSLVPKAAERLGLSLGQLCERECRRALLRRGGRIKVPA